MSIGSHKLSVDCSRRDLRTHSFEVFWGALMKRFASLIVASLALAGGAHAGTTGNGSNPSPVRPVPQAPISLAPVGPPAPYVCQYRDNQQKTFYMSGVVTSPAAVGQLSQAWSRYVLATYHASSAANGYCSQVHADAAGQQYTMQLIEKQQTADGLKIVHVDWTP